MAEAVPRSLAGNHAATMRRVAGEGRRFGNADHEAQREQHIAAAPRRRPRRRPGTAVNERPEEDAPANRPLGAEPVQQPAAGDLCET